MNHDQKLDAVAKEINDSGVGIDLEAQHFFGEGVYVRVLSVPANHAFIGKKHKTNHVFALIQGKLAITDEYGKRAIYNAPYFFESKAGARRSLLALTDSILMNAHATDTNKTVDEIEEALTVPLSNLVEKQ